MIRLSLDIKTINYSRFATTVPTANFFSIYVSLQSTKLQKRTFRQIKQKEWFQSQNWMDILSLLNFLQKLKTNDWRYSRKQSLRNSLTQHGLMNHIKVFTLAKVSWGNVSKNGKMDDQSTSKIHSWFTFFSVCSLCSCTACCYDKRNLFQWPKSVSNI